MSEEKKVIVSIGVFVKGKLWWSSVNEKMTEPQLLRLRKLMNSMWTERT